MPPEVFLGCRLSPLIPILNPPPGPGVLSGAGDGLVWLSPARSLAWEFSLRVGWEVTEDCVFMPSLGQPWLSALSGLEPGCHPAGLRMPRPK